MLQLLLFPYKYNKAFKTHCIRRGGAPH